MKRMWINQPSSLQPLHALHGTRVLACEERHGKFVQVYFLTGPKVSMMAPTLALSCGWPGEPSACPPSCACREPARTITAADLIVERLRRKSDQAWELAGLARQDGDTVDEQRWAAKARRYQQELKDYLA